MKRFVAVLITAFSLQAPLLPAALYAQDEPPEAGAPGMPMMMPEKMIDARIAYLKKELTLTAEQEKQVREILEKSVQDAKEKADTPKARRERLKREKEMQKQREIVDAKIKKVLSEEQIRKFDAMPEMERRARGVMDIDARLDQMEKRLNLTAEQKQKLRPVLERQDDHMRKLFEKTREENAVRDSMRVVMKNEREKSSKEIEAVLTPGQIKEYRAWQEEIFRHRGKRGAPEKPDMAK